MARYDSTFLTHSWFSSDVVCSLSALTIKKKNWLPHCVSLPIFLGLTEQIWFLISKMFNKNPFYEITESKNRHTSDLHTTSVCLSETITCVWNLIMTEYFLCRSLTFCVESVEQYFKLICIAITMEWRRVETSKTLFFLNLRTVTWRDAPIQIKYNHWTKFPLFGGRRGGLHTYGMWKIKATHKKKCSSL